MVGKTNVAGAKLFAAIGVTYPAGSTLSCTNGTSTLKAKTTTGQWVFAVPEPGTWTVTESSKNRSKSVTITAEGQFESVNLKTFEILNPEVNIITGWETDAHNTCSVTPGTNDIVMYYYSSGAVNAWAFANTSNIIEFGDYTTIKCEVEQEGGSEKGPFQFRLATSTHMTNSGNKDVVASTLIGSGSGVYSLPIGSLEQAYLRFTAYGIATAPSATLTVKRIWLE